MQELGEIFALLLALYLLESLIATRRFGIAFIRRWPGRYRAVRPFIPGPDDRLGVVIGDLLPPLYPTFVAQLWPLSISPDGIDADAPFAFPPGRHLWPNGDFLRFEQIERVATDGCHLLVNGRRFATAASPLCAAELTGLIERLRGQSRDERERTISARLREFYDSQAVRSRLQEFRSETATLRGVCLFLLFGLFVAAPVLTWQWGLELIWPVLLALLVPPWLLAAFLYWRADTRLSPGNRGLRIERLATVLALPVAAARGGDFSGRHLLAGFHPLAIAHVLLPTERFEALAKQLWRDMVFAVERSEVLEQNPARRAAADWFRRRMQNELEALLVRCAIWPPDLLAAPLRDEGGCRSYCPRCLEQSRLPEAECPFCGGIRLVAFEEPGSGDDPDARAVRIVQAVVTDSDSDAASSR